jgi:hypothetical protein
MEPVPRLKDLRVLSRFLLSIQYLWYEYFQYYKPKLHFENIAAVFFTVYFSRNLEAGLEVSSLCICRYKQNNMNRGPHTLWNWAGLWLFRPHVGPVPAHGKRWLSQNISNTGPVPIRHYGRDLTISLTFAAFFSFVKCKFFISLPFIHSRGFLAVFLFF